MINKKYKELYQQMAEEGHFGGGPRLLEWRIARKLFRKMQCSTLLDYGCGAGKQWHPKKVAEWGKLKPTLYDPAFAEHSKLPNQQFDMIMSTDVLEHIPDYTLPSVVRYCTSHVKKTQYHFIANRPAMKELPNGENAHCSQQPLEWWVDLFETHSVVKVPTILHLFSHKNNRKIVKLWFKS